VLEPNNIYLGDSYELIKQIPDKSIDLIVIDPPYDIEGGKVDLDAKTNDISLGIGKLANELLDNDICCGIDEKIFEDFMRVMKAPNIYIWCNKKQIPMYIDYFVNKHGCKFEILIWNKSNCMPLHTNKYLNDCEYCLYFRKGGYCNPVTYDDARTVYITQTNKRDKDLFEHPTIKPLNIIKTLIRNSSKENDVVLDCFLGSGTTAVACKDTNRRYIGIEKNERWYQVAKDRLDGVSASGQFSFILR